MVLLSSEKLIVNVEKLEPENHVKVGSTRLHVFDFVHKAKAYECFDLEFSALTGCHYNEPESYLCVTADFLVDDLAPKLCFVCGVPANINSGLKSKLQYVTLTELVLLVLLNMTRIKTGRSEI